jgi:sodium transport system permease protein
MNASQVGTVYTKELRDTLRDRRTLISMIVVPTLLMPLLFAVVGFIGFKVVRAAQTERQPIMVLGGEHAPALVAALEALEDIRLVAERDDWRERIADKRLRAAVEFPPGFADALAADEPTEVRLYHYEGEMKSGLALRRLRTFFADQRTTIVEERLTERGLPLALVRPYEMRAENVAPPEKVGGNLIGGFLPYLFIILCFAGAMYPAIDLTAGEKERGTMETILCSPVGRLELVLGKFLMVLTAALGTVIFTLLSTGGTFLVAGRFFGDAFGGGGAGGAGGAGGGALALLHPGGLLGMVAMILPFAVLAAAAQLAICLFAKSYKEAQSYVSPLIVVVILPAAIGLMPGVELNWQLALVPVLNLSLVTKEMVSGTFNWGLIGLIFASSWVYAAAALAWCVRLFNREEVLFRT